MPEAPPPPPTARGEDDAPEASRALARVSDLELLEGLRRGSEPHFGELYERYFPRIYAFAHARLRSHADAEEVVQDTFTSVFRSVDRYAGQSSLLSWIYGIAKNTINSHIRRECAEERRVERADPAALQPRPGFATGSPEEQLHLQRYADAVADHLGSVPSWQAEVFVMRHLENLSIPAICARTGRTGDAVRSSLYRIKRTLREAAADD